MTTSRELYLDMQMLVGGHPPNVVLEATATSLASAIGFVANDLADADRIVDRLGADMRQIIRTNWEYLRTARAQAGPAGHG